MKRRINNLHKGLFKLNKTSNIIELHSKKNNQEKDIEKDKENININQFRYINEEENNIKKSKNISKYDKNPNKRKSSLNKEREKEKDDKYEELLKLTSGLYSKIKDNLEMVNSLDDKSKEILLQVKNRLLMIEKMKKK